MKESTTDTSTNSANEYESICESNDAASLIRCMRRHLVSTLGADYRRASPLRAYQALSYSVRDRLIDNWIKTQRSYYDRQSKRVYYLSMEFLPGRFLVNSLINLGLVDECRTALAEFGYTLEEIEEQEWDPGLGNGGLGRLASCYLDSMATLGIPGYGYGIRYDFGIFYQLIEKGWQVERPDNWLRIGSPWQFDRPETLYEIKFYGRVVAHKQGDGRNTFEWVDTQNVMAMACDILVPGYMNGNAINMRLWSARSSRELHLDDFQGGDYIRAIEEKVHSETISKVLYPSESVRQGRELRLRQEYFFVAATFHDIMRRFKKRQVPFEQFPDRVAVQLNDTHPAIAVAELMRLLLDEEKLEWEQAWDITTRTFGYTNHTVMPEALESWPLEMIENVLPRHMQIIYEVNRRLIEGVEKKYPGDLARVSRMSLIAEGPERRVRMANLAIAGSHSVNGVSELHSRILREQTFADFVELWPERFSCKTNGITPRRFLLQANPELARLITAAIGPGWIKDLAALHALEESAENDEFCRQWREIKQADKRKLASWLRQSYGFDADPTMLFDIQVKRIHEYKRQLLNILHVIALANRIKSDPASVDVGRTVLIGGKAAPSYTMAKLIIKLVHAVGEVINNDPKVRGKLRLYFVPNYCVSTAERLLGACDLSEQISTAGMEASGTGNMKFALNGALIIGTLDGANIEIMDEIGPDNIFIFGRNADEVRRLRATGYNPRALASQDPDLVLALQQLGDGTFSPGHPDLFRPIVESLLDRGDYFMLCADFRSYLECQERVARAFFDEEEWTRRSILSVARMGKFSSDRAVREYAAEIWGVKPAQ